MPKESKKGNHEYDKENPLNTMGGKKPVRDNTARKGKTTLMGGIAVRIGGGKS